MWGFSLCHPYLCYQSFSKCPFLSSLMLPDSQAEVTRQSGQSRDWQLDVFLLKWRALSKTATGKLKAGQRRVKFKACGSFVSYQDGCVKHDFLVRHPEMSFALWAIAIVDSFMFLFWFPSLPEEGSTLLLNVDVTSSIYSLPTLKSLLCNLLKQSMQAKPVAQNPAAKSVHASRPFNLTVTIFRTKLFILKHSLAHTLWFMKDEQYT